jgi:hypothetical protein
MTDKKFSGIIRSGTSHSVSVSARTGNAKTPKNIVTSNAEETENRVKALHENSEHLLEGESFQRSEERRDAKASWSTLVESDDESFQSFNSDNLGDGGESVSEGSRHANHQVIHTGNSLMDNLQAVPSSVKSGANVQTVESNTVADNVQKIRADAIAPNLQNIPATESMGKNVQSIDVDSVDKNIQIVSADKSVDVNIQSIATDPIAKNSQRIDETHALPNVQDVANNQTISSNVQNIPIDNVEANVQRIAIDCILPTKRRYRLRALMPIDKRSIKIR